MRKISITELNETLVNEETGEIIEPKFSYCNNADKYIDDGVRWIKPMNAKEEKNEEKLEKMLEPNSGYFVEEKFDGTRATVHFFKDHCRVFSRRISKQTGWFVENTDLLPHIRDISCPELEGTIIDGELIMPGYPFKDVSSTLNCLPEKAIKRQMEKEFINLFAFDIVYYKGVNIKKMPLKRRKELLDKVINICGNANIECVSYFDEEIPINISESSLIVKIMEEDEVSFRDRYPNLYKKIKPICLTLLHESTSIKLNKKAYYELIVALGGEGLILKNAEGEYKHKRCKEYIKIKKFDTWDVIVIDYAEPTFEYDGKEEDDWEYWYHEYSDSFWEGKNLFKTDEECNSIPVTKFAFEGWIGAIEYGVIVTDEEIKEWEKRNDDIAPIEEVVYNGKEVKVLKVGEASGMTEEVREDFSRNANKYLGTCIEIMAQEVIKKTGKLRHPRFLRKRPDKDPSECTWKTHIRE